MFEIWVLQQILISIFIMVILGGFLSLILGYWIGRKSIIKEESVLKQD